MKYNGFKTSLKCVDLYIGESIEEKCRRIESNNEPIKDGAPIIYTEHKEGVIPAYDPRTDRFEIAAEAMDKVTRSQIAQRDKLIADSDKQGNKVVETPVTE